MESQLFLATPRVTFVRKRKNWNISSIIGLCCADRNERFSSFFFFEIQWYCTKKKKKANPSVVITEFHERIDLRQSRFTLPRSERSFHLPRLIRASCEVHWYAGNHLNRINIYCTYSRNIIRAKGNEKKCEHLHYERNIKIATQMARWGPIHWRPLFSWSTGWSDLTFMWTSWNKLEIWIFCPISCIKFDQRSITNQWLPT